MAPAERALEQARTAQNALWEAASECVEEDCALGGSEEEVESVSNVLGNNTVLSGFYSYGEISPFTPSTKCELHNQTMTITTLSER